MRKHIKTIKFPFKAESNFHLEEVGNDETGFEIQTVTDQNYYTFSFNYESRQTGVMIIDIESQEQILIPSFQLFKIRRIQIQKFRDEEQIYFFEVGRDGFEFSKDKTDNAIASYKED